MNKKQLAAVSLGVFFFIAGFLVLAEQYLVFGVWFQIEDVHHETIALSLFSLAIGLLIGVNSGRSKK
jgi:hypothetical protein